MDLAQIFLVNSEGQIKDKMTISTTSTSVDISITKFNFALTLSSSYLNNATSGSLKLVIIMRLQSTRRNLNDTEDRILIPQYAITSPNTINIEIPKEQILKALEMLKNGEVLITVEPILDSEEQ